MAELTIDSVCPKEQFYPMTINFQNGYPSEDFEVECAVLEDQDGTKVIATELCDLVYAGNEVKEELGQTFLITRNRNTGKVRILEVGHADLKPVSKVNLDTSQLQETSKLELSRKFGSKKQKKIEEQREKLKVNVQTVTEQMERVTANITEDKLDLSAYNKTDSEDFYVPYIDREATKVEDVYPVDKIMSDEEYERIHSELEGKDYMADMHPYMKSFIKGKSLTPRLTVLAAYASALLNFMPCKYQEVRKKGFVACSFSTTLNNILINGFTEISNGKRTRPQPLKDKLICYIIVILLILNNYKFEIEPICAALKMTAMTFGVKVRLVGGSVGYIGDKKMVQLKLPLVPRKTFDRRRKSAKF